MQTFSRSEDKIQTLTQAEKIENKNICIQITSFSSSFLLNYFVFVVRAHTVLMPCAHTKILCSSYERNEKKKATTGNN